jgi:hypothetical protein
MDPRQQQLAEALAAAQYESTGIPGMSIFIGRTICPPQPAKNPDPRQDPCAWDPRSRGRAPGSASATHQNLASSNAIVSSEVKRPSLLAEDPLVAR